jgi:hypothetical protein
MGKYAAPGLIALLLAGCGGGGSSLGPPPPPPTGQKIAGPGPNVATLTVNGGPAGVVNTAFVSVTICPAGSTLNCQTIDGIEVDTGSFGFRVMASVLTPALAQALPQQFAGTVPIVECAQFADGFSWGPVKSADLTISSETASSVPIQVIGDPTYLPPNRNIPTDCSSKVNNPENTVTSFGANGILGVGPFISDCGIACTTAPAPPGTYYLCAPNGAQCTNTTEPENLQVSNPVGSFTASGDDNGVIVELPSVTDGAASATGALVFGIGTQGNNGLGSATVLTADPLQGLIDIKFNGLDYPASYLDSGSDAIFFTDSALTVCGASTGLSGFYCSAASNLTATLTGVNGMQLTATFSISDAQSLFTASPNGTAFPSLGAQVPSSNSQTFDFGLPYFYGRNVFTAIENHNTPGGMGPYVAY